MYDGLSKHDLAIILAHQEYLAFRAANHRNTTMEARSLALERAFEFLNWMEQVDREDDIKVGLDD